MNVSYRDMCPVHSIFNFLYFDQNDQKQKNELHCLCLKMTADFGNFIVKTDKKQKTKDEMKQTMEIFFNNIEILALVRVE